MVSIGNLKTKTKQSSGFTIIELVVTVIVGGLLIVATNSAVNSYVSLGQHSKYLILANSFVDGEVESLRNQGYNSINIGASNISSQLPGGLLSPKSATLTVTSPSAGIKQLDISVSYTDGGTKTYAYTTYIGELGVGQ